MSDKKSSFPSRRALALALVSGALAGAVAVYVSTGLPGNNPGDAGGPEPGAAAQCAGKAAEAGRISGLATGDVAAMLAADPPQDVSTLAFGGPEGRPITLADRRGRTLLVNLWATWCLPCREEMPALDALQRDLGGDRFEVVAVNVDTGDDVKPRKFLAENKVDALAFYRDGSLDLFNELKRRGLALGLPVTMLVDAEGCLLAHMNGPAQWAGEDAKRFLRAAIGPS